MPTPFKANEKLAYIIKIVDSLDKIHSEAAGDDLAYLKKLMKIYTEKDVTDESPSINELANLYKSGLFKPSSTYTTDEITERREFIKTEMEQRISRLFLINDMKKFEEIIDILIASKFNFNSQIASGNTISELRKGIALSPQANTVIDKCHRSSEDAFRNTFLHSFIANEMTDLVSVLMKKFFAHEINLDFNRQDSEGKTVFSLLLRVLNPNIRHYPVRLLQTNTIDITIPDHNGDTPVHICVYLGLIECLQEMQKTLTKEEFISLLQRKNKNNMSALSFLFNTKPSDRRKKIEKVLRSINIHPDRDWNACRNEVNLIDFKQGEFCYIYNADPEFDAWYHKTYDIEEDDLYSPEFNPPCKDVIEQIIAAEERTLKSNSNNHTLGIIDDDDYQKLLPTTEEDLEIIKLLLEELKKYCATLDGRSVLEVCETNLNEMRKQLSSFAHLTSESSEVSFFHTQKKLKIQGKEGKEEVEDEDSEEDNNQSSISGFGAV